MARTTAQRIAKLETIRDQLEDRLEQMTLSPKVTYNVDGQMFDFNKYQEMLLKSLAAIDELLGVLDTVSGSGKLVSTQVFAGN